MARHLENHGHSREMLSDWVMVNGAVTTLTWDADGVLRWTDNRQRRLTVERDILGFTSEGSSVIVRTAVESSGGGICCVGSGGGDLVRKDFVFEPLSDDSRSRWCEKLRECLDSLGRPKRLFILVNPFGGKRSALKIFDDDVRPFLQAADIQFVMQETRYQLHAKEIVKTMDLSKYDGIVCVSGDGVLVEVLNGLLEREDWKDAIKTPIGLVPAGTGNGMVKSLLDAAGLHCNATQAICAVIRGHKCSLDVATIAQGETRFFSVLMLAWGLVADIDIESEKYRWMGSARIDFYALQRILHLRRYSGRILFVPAPGFEDYGHSASFIDDYATKQKSFSADKELSVKDHPCGYRGPDVTMEDLNWRALNGPFVSIWLHNVPWGAEDTMAAPDAKFSDGFLDLVLIRDCPKLALLSLMTKLSDGGHVKSPYVMYLKVKAFVLEPGSRVDEPQKGGIIDSDGEVLARGKGTYKCESRSLMSYDGLQISMDQGLATLFSPK